MALFQPTNITPSDLSGVGTIDALNDLPVTWQVNGTGNTPMTAYQIDIMMNDTESTLLYSTGQVALSNPFYGADAMGNPQYFTATITAAALAAAGVVNSKDNVYKLLITQWWSAGEYVQQSSASVFIARETPEVSITNFSPTITTVSYEFIGSYSQAQGDPIEWARWQISGSANNDVLVDTGRIYGIGELKTSYDGFLNGNNYIVRLSGQTVNGAEFDTGWQTFVADYEIEILDGAMTTCVRKDTDAVQISFPTPLYTMGVGGGDWRIDEYKYRTVGPADSVYVSDALEAPMKKLEVDIEPVQNLHGFDAPWVAGMGANKLKPNVNLPTTMYGVTITLEDGVFVLNGRATEAFQMPFDNWTSDYVTFEGIDGFMQFTFKMSGENVGSLAPPSAKVGLYVNGRAPSASSMDTVTFFQAITLMEYSSAGTVYHTKCYLDVPANYTFNNTRIKFSFFIGNTSTMEWSPYENICPISGRSSLNTFMGSKNMLNATFDTGTQNGVTFTVEKENGYVSNIIANGTATGGASNWGGAVNLLAGDYILTGCDGGSMLTYNMSIRSGSTSGDVLGQLCYGQSGGASVRIPSDGTYYLTMTVYTGTTVNDLEFWPMLRFANEEDETFEPYEEPTTMSVEFPAFGKNLLNIEAGTHNTWSFVNIPNNLEPNTQYTFSVNGETTYYYTLYLGNSEQSTRALSQAITGGESSTFTTPSDMSTEPLLAVAGSVSGAGDESISLVLPQVELGSSKTSYEPFTNIMYEGKYDFINGLLTVSAAKITLNTSTMSDATDYPGWNNVPGLRDIVGTGINARVPGASTSFTTASVMANTNSNNSILFFVKSDLGYTAPEFKAIYPNLDCDFIIPLKDPLTFQFDPREVLPIAGKYNIWSDAGKVTAQYAISNEAVLVLPTNADSVTWDTAGNAPFSISAPFGIAWRALLTDASASLPLFSVSMASGVLNAVVSSAGVNVTISGQLLFEDTATLANGDDVLLYIQRDSWALIVNGEPVSSGALQNWQDEITGIMLYGPQDCMFMWIVDNAFTMAQMLKAQNNSPAYDSTTHFLAQFNDGLSAGAIRSQVDVTRVTLYRRQAGKVTVQKLMTSDPRITAVRDYAALNGNTYTYTLVGETDGGNSTSAISSNSVSPCIWNYTLMLCSQDANGFYHVQQEYRFSLDISSGSENNNNNPTLQQNFTRYPLRQPNAQNYRSGTLTSFVAKAVNGKYVDSLSEIDALREISTSTLYKFLKNRKGEIMMVDTASPITTTITDKYEQQPVRAAIPWAEIGNAKGKSVIAVSGDTYWPNN